MAACIALLGGELTHDQFEHFHNLNDFHHHVLHIEQLANSDGTGANLTADPFEIPVDVNPEKIKAAVILDCETGEVSRTYGAQLPAQGIHAMCEQNIFILTNWTNAPQTVEEYKSNCKNAKSDPCAYLAELECCLSKLVKEQQCVSIDFTDRSARFEPQSKHHLAALERLIGEARIACEATKCGPNTSRGGYMNHSCHGRTNHGRPLR